MNFPDGADSWLEVFDHLVVIIGAIILAGVPAFIQSIRNHRGIRDIQAQVVNGHKDAPPMRADLDRAIAAIDDLGREVRGLRADLLAESHHRRTQISDLQDELDHRTGKHRRL